MKRFNLATLCIFGKKVALLQVWQRAELLILCILISSLKAEQLVFFDKLSNGNLFALNNGNSSNNDYFNERIKSLTASILEIKNRICGCISYFE